MINEMKDYVFCVEFTYPPGMVPESIPLANVERQLNTLKFYSKKKLQKDEVERIVKLIDSERYNKAKHITDRVGGLKYKCLERDIFSKEWVNSNG